jgi:hypothetical protein
MTDLPRFSAYWLMQTMRYVFPVPGHRRRTRLFVFHIRLQWLLFVFVLLSGTLNPFSVWCLISTGEDGWLIIFLRRCFWCSGVKQTTYRSSGIEYCWVATATRPTIECYCFSVLRDRRRALFHSIVEVNRLLLLPFGEDLLPFVDRCQIVDWRIEQNLTPSGLPDTFAFLIL